LKLQVNTRREDVMVLGETNSESEML
jgi:hypothetical protein